MRALALASVGVLLASCGGGGGGGDDGSPSDPDVWHFRGVNLISDSPQVQFYVDDTAVSTAEYGFASEYKPAHTGEKPIKLGIRNPVTLEEDADDPGYTDIGSEETFNFEGPTDYTLIAAGTVADPHMYLITGTERDDVADNRIELQVINAAPDSGTLGIYIKGEDVGIDDFELIRNLDPGEFSGKRNLTIAKASGDTEDETRSARLFMQVRSGGTVIFQSPAFTVTEVTRLLVSVTENDGPPGSAPVKLLVVGGIAAGAGGPLLDRSDPGELRFANLSPDSGPLDLIVGSDTAMDIFASNVALGAQSPYDSLAVGTYNSIATPAGNPGVFDFVNTFTTVRGRSSTLYAQGNLGDMRGLIIADDRRSVPTDARFRFLHAAPSESGSALDIYIVPDGVELDVTGADAMTPRVSDLTYRGASGQMILEEGSYDVYVTHANADHVELGPVDLELTDGSVQTLTLVDSGTGELQLLPVNDARD